MPVPRSGEAPYGLAPVGDPLCPKIDRDSALNLGERLQEKGNARGKGKDDGQPGGLCM